MGGTAYPYEGAQLGVDRALQNGEHCVGMLVLHRDDEVGEDGGVLLFVMRDDVRPVGGRFECCVDKLKVVVIMIYVLEACS